MKRSTVIALIYLYEIHDMLCGFPDSFAYKVYDICDFVKKIIGQICSSILLLQDCIILVVDHLELNEYFYFQ